MNEDGGSKELAISGNFSHPDSTLIFLGVNHPVSAHLCRIVGSGAFRAELKSGKAKDGGLGGREIFLCCTEAENLGMLWGEQAGRAGEKGMIQGILGAGA